MSDIAFFGDRRKVTFDEGKEINGAKIECANVIVGGHSQNIKGTCHECGGYVNPYITKNLMDQAKEYEENYKKEGKSADYKGVIPYIGSNIEKWRSKTRDIDTFEHPDV